MKRQRLGIGGRRADKDGPLACSEGFRIEMPKSKKPLSDVLMDAALRIHEMPPELLAQLLMKAAIRLRVIQQTGIRLEHIPVYAYHLLRRISHDPVAASTIHGKQDVGAVEFLVSRELIRLSDDGQSYSITAAGEELGEIADERSLDHP
jgi:hypothetical protein